MKTQRNWENLDKKIKESTKMTPTTKAATTTQKHLKLANSNQCRFHMQWKDHQVLKTGTLNATLGSNKRACNVMSVLSFPLSFYYYYASSAPLFCCSFQFQFFYNLLQSNLPPPLSSAVPPYICLAIMWKIKRCILYRLHWLNKKQVTR